MMQQVNTYILFVQKMTLGHVRPKYFLEMID